MLTRVNHGLCPSLLVNPLQTLVPSRKVGDLLVRDFASELNKADDETSGRRETRRYLAKSRSIEVLQLAVTGNFVFIHSLRTIRRSCLPGPEIYCQREVIKKRYTVYTNLHDSNVIFTGTLAEARCDMKANFHTLRLGSPETAHHRAYT